ncbi:MAG: AlpA family phage regulatory protein [Proteobacteria bacterium]|nr:AlpA family phage regulatory protein [Pseudomonadota bacterium]
MTIMSRAPKVCSDTGRGRSSLYSDVNAGLFPPPIKIGSRASAWPDYEVQAINNARIAGFSENQIRQLVTKLIAVRDHVAGLSVGEFQNLIASMIVGPDR